MNRLSATWNQRVSRRGVAAAFGLFGCLILTFLAYLPGLHGPLLFDDYNNIVYNEPIRIEHLTPSTLLDAVMSGSSGPLKRPLTMATFAVNHALTGLKPYGFKLTNVLIHCLNGVLVFLVCRRLLQLRARVAGDLPEASELIALSAAAVWLAHPVQLTSVLYVVQRMTSLSATFVLAGLLVYLHARAEMLLGRPARWALWVGVPACAVLAVLAKENGALLPLFAFVIEASLLRFRTACSSRMGSLGQFFALCLVLPLFVAAVFLATNPQWIDKPRDFTVMERLLTEPRALWMYVQLLFAPAISQLSLYYDGFEISRGLFAPATTGIALAGLLVAVASACILRTSFPWYAFAVLWFLAAHSLESSFIMLELVHPHRNYMAYLGPILAVSVGAARALKCSRDWIAVAVAATAVGLALIVTLQRSVQWGDPIRHAAWEVQHQPESPRANYELGRVYYLVNLRQPNEATRALAEQQFLLAGALEPQGISALIGRLILNADAADDAAERAFSELTRRLALYPLKPRDVVYIKSIVTCLEKKICVISATEILGLFGAILGNEGLSAKVRADTLTMLGMYYANVLGDAAGCVRVMREAVALEPTDLNYRLNLVRALIVNRDYANAEFQLDAVNRLDHFGAHRRRANEYRSDLTQLRLHQNDLTSR